eukprot:CAMPEP_0197026358 /NCGR_PEP_ID=MMETSP1384-20130603/6463_1 /TAXON_ID=29189 /ORGANISM="Ammonia sp." /LENGTH=226 /DNA_ID=CAMNT_0042455003 /DNA_START=54 /DNA_END=734 /DNA_ORIENTATION=+
MSETNSHQYSAEGVSNPPPAYAPHYEEEPASAPPLYHCQQPPASAPAQQVVYQQPVMATSKQPVRAVPGSLPPQYSSAAHAAQPTYPAANAMKQPLMANSNTNYNAYPAQQGQGQQVIVMPVSNQPAYATTTTAVVVTGPSRNNMAQQPAPPNQDLTCLSLLACLCCGCLCGLFALMFSSNAQAAYRRQDYAEYRRQQSNAKVCIGMSFVTGVVVFIVYLSAGASG